MRATHSGSAQPVVKCCSCHVCIAVTLPAVKCCSCHVCVVVTLPSCPCMPKPCLLLAAVQCFKGLATLLLSVVGRKETFLQV